MKKLLALSLLLSVFPSFATEISKEFYDNVKNTCREKSALDNAEIVGEVVDTESQAIAVVRGPYSQGSKKGQMGTVFCLYAKGTDKVEIVETSLSSLGWCSSKEHHEPDVASKEDASSKIKSVPPKKNRPQQSETDAKSDLSATEGTSWRVQAGSFKLKTKAQQLVDQLAKTSITSDIVKAGKWYAVRLAPQASEAAAKEQVEKLWQLAKVKGLILEPEEIVENPETPPISQAKWVIQAGSFLTSVKAEQVLQQLETKGISAQVVKEGKWYTVRLMPQDNAQAAKQQLEQLYRVVKIKGMILK